MPDSVYLHGSEPHEQERLARLNAFMNGPTMDVLAPRAGDRVLDVGSGLGELARACGDAVGADGYVLGIERDPAQLARANALGAPSQVEYRQGDATAMPLTDDERGSFDLVYTRFVLEHLPEPLVVITQMREALRPGGRIVLIDDDHGLMTVRPPCPGLETAWSMMLESYGALGCDARIGAHLIGLLVEAGLAPRRNGMFFFGSCAGSDTWDLISTNMREVVRTARPTIEAFGLGDLAAFDAGLDEMTEWAARPDAAIWYPACWAEGARA